MKPYKQPVSVLVVIYSVQGQVLLIERADHPGYWQSVTGSLEVGESTREAALREVLEETGIRADEGVLTDWQQVNHYEIYTQWRHRYAPGVTQNQEHVFGLALPCELPVTLAAGEHLAWQWLPAQDAIERVFSPSNAEALQQLAASIGACKP